MNKEMIVSSNGHETMVAILEDDLVAEIFVERERHRGVGGNVYKGRVSKVLPGMQSSFIDLGIERDGFLYVADVIDTLVEFDKLAGDDEDEAGGAANGGGGPKGRGERDRQDRPQQKIEDQVHRDRTAHQETRGRGLQREGHRHGHNHADRFHSDTPAAASRAGVGVSTTSTSSSDEKSTAGLIVMRLYAPPARSTASMRPIVKPFG